jgi:hypothetical protein
MKSNTGMRLVAVFAAAACIVTASAAAETILSPAQIAVVDAQIAKLGSPEERALASEWNDAKKVAECICRPLANSELQKWNKKADRVFLGTDDPSTLELTSSRRLTGSGEVRTGSDWTDFTFSCEVDPQTGAALSFETSLGST